MARGCPGLVPVAAVEGRLAAARLSARKRDLHPLVAQQFHRRFADFREEEIDETGYEEGSFHEMNSLWDYDHTSLVEQRDFEPVCITKQRRIIVRIV